MTVSSAIKAVVEKPSNYLSDSFSRQFVNRGRPFTGSRYEHLIKNSVFDVALGFSWFHNEPVERQPAGEGG